jgi:hypothetical protein
LPVIDNADFVIAIVNVPLEDNWYSRRLGDGKIVFTFYEVKEILRSNNIPLENAVFRLLYSYTLRYKRSGNTIPAPNDGGNFTHDETRGCIFDFHGVKSEIAISCDKPIICDECKERLREDRVSESVIAITQEEISNIHKQFYYQILDFIKRHPGGAFFMSSIYALVLGVIGSLLASWVSGRIVNKQHQVVINHIDKQGKPN